MLRLRRDWKNAVIETLTAPFVRRPKRCEEIIESSNCQTLCKMSQNLQKVTEPYEIFINHSSSRNVVFLMVYSEAINLRWRTS